MKFASLVDCLVAPLVLTVHDEWKMALMTVLVEVERVKMAVVCRSADTEHTGNSFKETG